MISLSNILNELEIPSGKWVELDLNKIDDDGMKRIWQMYITTYLNAGMDLSASSWREMQSKYKATALKDVDSDNLPDAFIVYKQTKFGNKIALLGTNNKKTAKSDVVKKVIQLCNTSGWFLEASLKMEDIMKSSGAPVVTDEEKIQAIVGPDKKVQFVGDGYYTRSLSKVNKRITKRHQTNCTASSFGYQVKPAINGTFIWHESLWPNTLCRCSSKCSTATW